MRRFYPHMGGRGSIAAALHQSHRAGAVVAADNAALPYAISPEGIDLMKAKAQDIRDQPAYGPAEAARYLRLPAATLRSWVVGRVYPKAHAQARFEPLIRPATTQPLQLSFYNLIEAHVLRALRTEHGVALAELRKAIAYAERKLDLHRLLLSPELSTHAGRIFLDHYAELMDLSASGQLAMRKLLEDHLQRVEWDDWKFPVRLYPYVGASQPAGQRPIAIDPHIAFGRPIVQRAGVSTTAIADRIDAGESVAAIAEDYDLSAEEVEQAVLYSRAA